MSDQWITGDNSTNEAMEQERGAVVDPVQFGVELLRHYSTNLSTMGAMNLRMLRKVLAGYEEALARIERAKQGHTPPPPYTHTPGFLPKGGMRVEGIDE